MNTSDADAVYEALAHLWADAYTDACTRYSTISDYADAQFSLELQGTADNDELRANAIHAAHQLAGSLGTFGFPRGSEIARQLEHTLDADTGDAETRIELRTLTAALAEVLAANAPGSTTPGATVPNSPA